MEKKKVVVQFIEAGMGHIVTAEAIAECLEKKYSDKIEVIRDYLFRDSNQKHMQKFEKFCIKEVQKSNRNRFYLRFQMFCMKLFGERFSLWFVYGFPFRRVRNSVINRMKEQNAHAYVSTYFMLYHSGVVAKCKKQINSSVIAYNPDHNTHGWWDRKGDIFITNNPFANNEAIFVRKMKKENVKQVNFMARDVVVNANESKEFYREKYNIPQDKLTVLLSDGAYAAARLEEYTDALLKLDNPLTIIVVCGKNERLLKKYEQIANNTKQNITLLPFGFVSNIPELYKASDVFITKAGPNAITDCVFMGTPILANFYSGAIERASCHLFTKEYKCGIYEPNVKKAVEKIKEWIQNRQELDEYAKNTICINKFNNGAEEVADIIAKKIL